MRSSRSHRWLALWLLAGALALFNGNASAAPNCANSTPLDIRLPNGTRWEMCWSVDAHSGIKLSQIYLTLPNTERRRILRDASIAQIHQAYDNSVEVVNHVTRIGLGGRRLKTLLNADCAGGNRAAAAGREVLCHRILPRGLAFKFQGISDPGELLELFSVSQTGRTTFVVRWHFHDDGTIVPGVGISGKLKHYSTNPAHGWPIRNRVLHAVGSTFNIFWRLDFAVGNIANDDRVEQFEAVPSASQLTKTFRRKRVSREARLRVSAKNKRSWRVVDSAIRNSDAIDGRGHLISYHLEPVTTGHRYIGPRSEPWSHYDLFVTRRRGCERFATDNARLQRNCGNSVYDFVNGGAVNQADVVLWYKITRHELPSSEDEPVVPMDWNTFQLVPRDWSPRNPLTGQRDAVDSESNGIAA